MLTSADLSANLMHVQYFAVGGWCSLWASQAVDYEYQYRGMNTWHSSFDSATASCISYGSTEQAT